MHTTVRRSLLPQFAREKAAAAVAAFFVVNFPCVLRFILVTVSPLLFVAAGLADNKTVYEWEGIELCIRLRIAFCVI